MTFDLPSDVRNSLEKTTSEYSRYVYLIKYCIQQKKYDKVSEYFQIAETLKIKLDLALHLLVKDIDESSGKYVYVDFQKGEMIIDG